LSEEWRDRTHSPSHDAFTMSVNENLPNSEASTDSTDDKKSA
jgi:hypothetical protein